MSNQTSVIFPSAGLKLSGSVHTPTDLKTGEPRPACLNLMASAELGIIQNPSNKEH
jgi:hypothetical protein